MLRPGRILAVLALVAVLVLAGGMAGTVTHLRGNITTAPLRTGTDAAQGDAEEGDLTILLLGSDSRDLAEESFGEADGSRRSDAMVLAHLSADDGRIDAVQLPRDTLLDLPACADTGRGSFSGGRGMLNSALNYGPACSVAAVEELTGVRIDHFVELDFEGFIAIIDALGGLPVCLPESMEDPAADLDLPAGEQTLDGRDALALARTRHAVGDGSDIARLGHQQMVMSAVVQEATSRQVVARPDRLYSFLDATTSALTVDPGLSAISDMASLGSRVSRVPTESITFVTMPWEPAPGDPNRVVPSAEAEAVFEDLAGDVPLAVAGTGSGHTTSSEPEGAEGSGSGEASSSQEPTSDAEAPADGRAEESSTSTTGTTVRTADVDLCSD
ncbi:transcriptional regulator [Brachybacterium alimentarium]|uniref:Transcriptional regulator n=1 Tax=Brachybacterium alimentarium TaxID=47845 RepID=A0A2A3YEK6_9MICO|nr:transcriptional regulator [Brachybacterium alimentarium]